MPIHDLTSTQLSRAVCIPYQTLDFWLRTGIFACDVPASGIGTRRRFTVNDITLTLIIHQMKQDGHRMAAARNVVGALRQQWTDDDPEHAGCVLTTAPLDPTAARWFPAWLPLRSWLDATIAGREAPAFYFALDARVPARHAVALLQACLTPGR